MSFQLFHAVRLLQQVLVVLMGFVCTLLVEADTIDTSGQEPYEQCGYCHEFDGNSRMPQFPKLAGQPFAYLKKQLQDFRSGQRDGKGVMQEAAQLLQEDDIDVVAQYFSQQVRQASATSHVQQVTTVNGERLYLQGDRERGIGACAECHDRGSPPSPSLRSQHASYLIEQLYDFRKERRRNDAGGVMRAIAKKMTDQEIVAVSQYVSRLPAL